MTSTIDIGIDNELHPLHQADDEVGGIRRRRRNVFSMFRRVQQRISFQNRWKKSGVKFDPKFHFIIGQLIIKDIVKADGVMYPDSPQSSKSSKKKHKKTSRKSQSGKSQVKRNSINSPSRGSASQRKLMEHGQDSLPSTPSTSFSTPSSSYKRNDEKVSPRCIGTQRKKRSQTQETELSQRCLDCTERCPICWEGYKVGEKVCWSKNENCTHAFHFDCIVTWLVDHDHCPMCRSPYLTKKENKEDGRSGNGNRNGSSNGSRNGSRNGNRGNNRNSASVRVVASRTSSRRNGNSTRRYN